MSSVTVNPNLYCHTPLFFDETDAFRAFAKALRSAPKARLYVQRLIAFAMKRRNGSQGGWHTMSGRQLARILECRGNVVRLRALLVTHGLIVEHPTRLGAFHIPVDRIRARRLVNRERARVGMAITRDRANVGSYPQPLVTVTSVTKPVDTTSRLNEVYESQNNTQFIEKWAAISTFSGVLKVSEIFDVTYLASYKQPICVFEAPQSTVVLSSKNESQNNTHLGANAVEFESQENLKQQHDVPSSTEDPKPLSIGDLQAKGAKLGWNSIGYQSELWMRAFKMGPFTRVEVDRAMYETTQRARSPGWADCLYRIENNRRATKQVTRAPIQPKDKPVTTFIAIPPTRALKPCVRVSRDEPRGEDVPIDPTLLAEIEAAVAKGESRAGASRRLACARLPWYRAA